MRSCMCFCLNWHRMHSEVIMDEELVFVKFSSFYGILGHAKANDGLGEIIQGFPDLITEEPMANRLYGFSSTPDRLFS